MEDPNIGFIVGPPHSGTTLLANIIGHHRNIYVPNYETSAFLKKHRSHLFDQALEEKKESGKEYLIEKSPKHLFKTKRIKKEFFDPKFICILRNGFDVSASFIKRTGSYHEGLNRWLDAVKEIYKLENEKNFKLIFFENLIFDTQNTLNDITNFLNLEFDPLCLSYYKNPRLWFGREDLKDGTGEDGKEHLKHRNYQINQPIDPSQVNSYVNKLSRKNIKTIAKNKDFDQFMKYYRYIH